MMDVFSGFLAGVLQGVFEWLPISSSGQNMLFLMDFIHLDASSAFSLGILLHVGTLSAVLVKYRATWFNLPKDPKLLKFLVYTSLFTGLTGLILYVLVKRSLTGFSGEYLMGLVGLMLVVTGAVLYATRKKNFGVKNIQNLSFFETAVIGAAQGFSILPGISRSGVTFAALALSEVGQKEALRLSFLMSVPAVAGAVGLELLTDGFSTVDLWVALAGLTASFAFGYLLIEALTSLASKVRFEYFCILFGSIAFLSAFI